MIQCDPEWCGGISELQKICALAVDLRCPGDPARSQPSRGAAHGRQPIARNLCPLAEYLVLKMRSYYHFEKNPPVISKAHFTVPDTPGFGIELDPSKIESSKAL